MQAQQQQEVQFTGCYDWGYLIQVCQGYGDYAYSAEALVAQYGFTEEAYNQILFWWNTWL